MHARTRLKRAVPCTQRAARAYSPSQQNWVHMRCCRALCLFGGSVLGARRGFLENLALHAKSRLRCSARAALLCSHFSGSLLLSCAYVVLNSMLRR